MSIVLDSVQNSGQIQTHITNTQKQAVGGGGILEWKFLYVILKLCAEFQFPTMTTTGQKFVV